MALSIKDFSAAAFYKSEVDQKATFFEPALNTMYSRLLTDRGGPNGFLERLQAREDRFLKTFMGEVSGDPRETLKKGFKEVQTSGYGLERLSGPDLAVTLYEYNRQMKHLNALSEAEFQQFLTEHIIPMYGGADPSQPNENLERWILEYVNATVPVGEGKFKVRGHKRLRKIPLSDLHVTDLAPVTQQRIRAYIAAAAKSSGVQVRRQDLNGIVIGNNNNSITISAPTDGGYIDWYSMTHGRKAAFTSVDEALIANNRFREQFKAYIAKKATKAIPRLDEILDYVFDKNKKALFVGNNIKDITGLVGEIQALCYFSILMGGRFSLNSKTVDWVATSLSGGKQFHADLTWARKYGIQVKNSVKDVVDSIHFYDGKLDYFLQQIPPDLLSDIEKQIIIQTYATYYFNVPYMYTADGGFQRGPNMVYQPTYDTLERLVGIADKLLLLLSDSLLYIGLGNAAQNEKGNVLYVIGGRDLIFASEIIKEILDAIKNQVANPMALNRPAETYNIVNFLRDKPEEVKVTTSRAGRVSHGIHKGAGAKYGEEITQQIVDKIVLKSAYDFTSLLNKQQIKGE